MTDTLLFYKVTSSSTIYILIYVEDILITGLTISIDTLINSLMVKFALRDMGPTHFFLGVELTSIPIDAFSPNTNMCWTCFVEHI